MSDDDCFFSTTEKERLKKILLNFELSSIFIDAIIFIKEGDKFKIIFDHSLVSNSSEELEYWFYHLDFRNIINMKLHDMKGFIDIFKNRFDVIARISNDVYIFLSKSRDSDNLYENEKALIEKLLSDLQEITWGQYA